MTLLEPDLEDGTPGAAMNLQNGDLTFKSVVFKHQIRDWTLPAVVRTAIVVQSSPTVDRGVVEIDWFSSGGPVLPPGSAHNARFIVVDSSGHQETWPHGEGEFCDGTDDSFLWLQVSRDFVTTPSLLGGFLSGWFTVDTVGQLKAIVSGNYMIGATFVVVRDSMRVARLDVASGFPEDLPGGIFDTADNPSLQWFYFGGGFLGLAAVATSGLSADILDASAPGRALLTAASVALQRTALALGSMATQDVGAFDASGLAAAAQAASQPLDADLTALAGLPSAADKVPYFTGAAAAALATLTTAGRAIIAGIDAAAQRITLGLGTAATAATTAFDAAGAAATAQAAAQAASQPLDAELTALAGLTSAADKVPYFTGLGTAALATLTAAGRALVAGIDAAAQRTTLGLGTAATSAASAFDAAGAATAAQAAAIAASQPVDAELTAIAGLISAADRVPYFTGLGAAALATLTTAGRALIAAVDAAAERTVLGLGSLATQDASAIAITGGTITGLPSPTGTSDAATKAYVDGLVSGLAWKTSVVAATTGAGTLATSFANGQTIDGVVLATGNRILLKNQAAGAENGIYVVPASGAPARATDADAAAELLSAAVFVQQGTANADRAWVCTNDAIVLGTTAIVFVGFAAVNGALIAANNLSDVASAATARTNLGLVPLAATGLAADISDATAVGRLMLKAATQAAQTALIALATTSLDGLLAAADKVKLNGLATLASTPTSVNITDATAVGRSMLTAADQAAQTALIAPATTSLAGTLAAADKTKINNLLAIASSAIVANITDAGAWGRTVVQAATQAAGTALVALATQALAGLMSAADKTKLDAAPVRFATDVHYVAQSSISISFAANTYRKIQVSLNYTTGCPCTVTLAGLSAGTYNWIILYTVNASLGGMAAENSNDWGASNLGGNGTGGMVNFTVDLPPAPQTKGMVWDHDGQQDPSAPGYEIGRQARCRSSDTTHDPTAIVLTMTGGSGTGYYTAWGYP